jgi:predicted nuclease with TOPRIM domain
MDDRNSCTTCCGTPHASERTCICGGVGTRDAETDGLRQRAFKLEEKLAVLREDLERVVEERDALREEMQRHAKEFYALPYTRGGSVESRRGKRT